ncbi:hypothetical protein CDAR_500841 [Caerostris darwini]|uniref:Uncharacterized protein n=1 Tax=Caerostris darwini TaxID=1538125 RepID=A0AAV4NJC3_9ARAC|nr:hypothetical protein CDAR_500841 [Caerostris darwini]
MKSEHYSFWHSNLSEDHAPLSFQRSLSFFCVLSRRVLPHALPLVMSHFTTPSIPATPEHHYRGLLSSAPLVHPRPSPKSFKNGVPCNRIFGRTSELGC